MLYKKFFSAVVLALCIFNLSFVNANQNNSNSKYNDYAFAMCNYKDLCGLVDINGNTIIPFEYYWIKVNPAPYSKIGNIIVSKDKDLNSKYGVISKDGKVLIDTNYQYLRDFGDNLYQAKLNNKFGLIDLKNNVIIPIKYKRLSEPKEYLMKASYDGKKWGYVDIKGREVIPFIYDEVNDFNNSFAKVKKGGKYGLIDKSGKFVIEPKYDYISRDFNNPYLIVRTNKKSGIMDLNGKVLTPFEYDSIKSNYYDNVDMHGALKNNKYGFITKNNKVIVPFIYDNIKTYQNGYAYVLKNKRWFYIDKNGKEAIPTVDNKPAGDKLKQALENVSYEYIKGYYKLPKNKIIDKNALQIIPEGFYQVYLLSNNLFDVKKDSHGFYDTTGKKLTDCVYDYSFDQRNGVIEVDKYKKMPLSGLLTGYDLNMGVINSLGKEIIPVKYDRVEFAGSEFIVLTKSRKIALYDKEGRMIFRFGKFGGISLKSGVQSRFY